MTFNKIRSWNNGNALVELYQDGTRTVQYDDQLKLTSPLNVDIRVSTKCAFGMSPTGNAVCSFCHESATTDGEECDYASLANILAPLPAGTEIAIGANQLTDHLIEFLQQLKDQQLVANLTINQGHLHRDQQQIEYVIGNQLIYGLGISYRRSFKPPPDIIANYPHAVWHVIVGIDPVDDIIKLSTDSKIAKLLILGEKDFGFNKGKLALTTDSRFWWYRKVHQLFDKFDVVSFDNLALQQLNVSRFVPTEQWTTIYQGEHSMYIDAVAQKYSPSSRSDQTVQWNGISLLDYFKQLESDRENQLV